MANTVRAISLLVINQFRHTSYKPQQMLCCCYESNIFISYLSIQKGSPINFIARNPDVGVGRNPDNQELVNIHNIGSMLPLHIYCAYKNILCATNKITEVLA